MSRKCSELEAELEALKARVRALVEAPAERREAPAEEVESDRAPGPGTAVPVEFDELVNLLKQEVEGMQPLTCLAIFGLGVLTGRLLAP